MRGPWSPKPLCLPAFSKLTHQAKPRGMAIATAIRITCRHAEGDAGVEAMGQRAAERGFAFEETDIARPCRLARCRRHRRCRHGDSRSDTLSVFGAGLGYLAAEIGK